MKFLKIQNNGLLDPRLIPLMGGTTKRDDSSKIGQFGTGLKYSLAYLIRNKIEFKLFVGEAEINITTVKESIAGQDFDIVFIDGEKTSITAQMGYDWKPWMIVREIWCNALDEGGAKKEVTEITTGTENVTSFFIELNIAFAKVWQNWTRYFVQEFEPLFSCAMFAIYAGSDKLRLYKQGVLIKEMDSKSVFCYDIKTASLNELREFQGGVDYSIAECLKNITDPKIITYFLEGAKEDVHYEGKHLSFFDWQGIEWNEAWKETIGSAKLIHQKAIDTIEARGIKMDLASTITVPENIYKELVKSKGMDGIGALRVADKVGEFFEIYSLELEMKIKQALAILESCGYFIHAELKFVYGVFGDKTVVATISLDKKEILISEKLLDRPLFDVITTIVEENEHFRTGHEDCSRSFQQHFIDLFTKTLMDKNEVLI